ncbi:MAG: hypothetical protein WCG06_05705 [Candidatus Omnitrophota bacterium]
MGRRNTKSSGASNLLRVSGIIFALEGLFHVMRYYRQWDFKIAQFELTYFGSLLIGILLLVLSGACFLQSK